jgi:hypothetical protein
VHRKRVLSVLAVVAVAVAGTVGVSSGASGSTRVQVQGIDGNTIKIGGMFDSLSFAGADAGFEARIDARHRAPGDPEPHRS